MFASAGKRKYPFLNQEICHQAANVQHRILTDSQHFLPKRVCIGNQLESSNQTSPEEQHYVNNNLNNNSMCEGNRQQSVRCTRCEAGQGGHFQHIFQ
ncbi:uncharacterized protein LOC110448653 isoform X2 [Mizuhopecten yessoensis]|uniref:uncharacterized protein LOC110448653 isoform X2 n=1 Tax=Mizuhopecten yessoensis TaxID=6573 RepID=UPI000B45D736|nr:uncharacterized protein LOC110448653 isoform X2 [Mizuhopecten yessoensis]